MKARRLEVVTLFRQCLRSAKRCPSFDQAEFLRIYVRRKFRESITLRDQTLITHLIKEGIDELKTMESFHAARASREGYIPNTSIREEVTNQTLSQISLPQSSINKSREENAKESNNEQSILTSTLSLSNSNPQTSANIINNVQHIDDELMIRKRNAELRIAHAKVRLAEALARKAEIEADKAEADAIKAESAIISELKPRN